MPPAGRRLTLDRWPVTPSNWSMRRARSVGRARLRHLTRSLDALVAAEPPMRARSPRAQGCCCGLRSPTNALLEPRHCEPAEDRYRQHLVHVHPAGRYSVVALVWKPGQATPIHDHRCWCVVGVWRGLERETTYDLRGDIGSHHLTPRGRSSRHPATSRCSCPPMRTFTGWRTPAGASRSRSTSTETTSRCSARASIASSLPTSSVHALRRTGRAPCRGGRSASETPCRLRANGGQARPDPRR